MQQFVLQSRDWTTLHTIKTQLCPRGSWVSQPGSHHPLLWGSPSPWWPWEGPGHTTLQQVSAVPKACVTDHRLWPLMAQDTLPACAMPPWAGLTCSQSWMIYSDSINGTWVTFFLLPPLFLSFSLNLPSEITQMIHEILTFFIFFQITPSFSQISNPQHSSQQRLVTLLLFLISSLQNKDSLWRAF